MQLHLIPAIAAIAATVSAHAASPYTATSPDGRTRVELAAGDGQLTYAVLRDGATVIAPSPRPE
jgi:alpha-glucosidase